MAIPRPAPSRGVRTSAERHWSDPDGPLVCVWMTATGGWEREPGGWTAGWAWRAIPLRAPRVDDTPSVCVQFAFASPRGDALRSAEYLRPIEGKMRRNRLGRSSPRLRELSTRTLVSPAGAPFSVRIRSTPLTQVLPMRTPLRTRRPVAVMDWLSVFGICQASCSVLWRRQHTTVTYLSKKVTIWDVEGCTRQVSTLASRASKEVAILRGRAGKTRPNT